MRELVSITIPTYNSERSLGECLVAAKKQTYKNTEIIVIDSYSKDKTLEIAKKFKCKLLCVKVNF